MEQEYTTKQDYKVFVRCNTFNQSKYIEDALNGFAMQITNFPFVSLVMDDCSTDGEQDVIKAWMERECDMAKAEYTEIELSNIIVVPHKSNANCTFAFYLLKRNTWKEVELKVAMYATWRNHCEYEALCEGDDYWISENHLQSKVDWLDNHSEYTACVNNIKVVFAGPYPIRKIVACKKDIDLSIEDMISQRIFIQTASLVIRESIYIKRCEELPNFSVGDYPLYVYAAHNGKIRMQKEYMTVYRVGVPGSCNTSDLTKNEELLLKRLTNSHYLLETLNEFTHFQYDPLFKNRWYVNLMRYYKHTHRYDQMRKAFSRISDKVDTKGLKWTIGHVLGCYFRLFDLHILKS